MSLKEVVLAAAASPKVNVAQIAATSGTGATYLFWIPNDIGKLAIVVSILLSVILIRVQCTTQKKLNMEIEDMKRDREERKKKIADRRLRGDKCARSDD
jgi:predicted transporter